MKLCNFLLQANGLAGFGDLILLFFSVSLTELTVNV